MEGSITLSARLNAALWRVIFGPIGRLLPFGACRRLAGPLAWGAWHLGARREVALRNLRLAFPGLDNEEREKLARRSLASLLTVYLELPTLRHLSDAGLRRAITIENLELLTTIGPEGALLLSGHFGNWELLAYGAAALAGIPFSIIVKEQRDYGQLERMRTSRGNRLIPTSRGAREATALLRSGGVIAMLADQSAGEGDELVEMFGIPTYTYAAPARLALRFRPRVIVGFAVREEKGAGGYNVQLRELRHGDLEDTPEGVHLFTQRYVEMLEETIREHPEQWVWQHRKWKNTPGISYDRPEKEG